MAALATYLAAIELVLWLIRLVQRSLDPQASGLAGWIIFIGVILGFVLIFLGARWFRRVVMWRLRNHLFVTYAFIGVIPIVLLLTIGTVAAYLFAGQFATFVVTSDIAARLRSLQASCRMAANSLSTSVAAGVPLEKAAASLRLDDAQHSLTVWTGTESKPAKALVIPTGAPRVSFPPKPEPATSFAVAGDEKGVYLRAWTTVDAGREKLTLIATEPLDKSMLEKLAANFGEITLSPPDFRRPQNTNPTRTSDSDGSEPNRPKTETGGNLVFKSGRDGGSKVWVRSGESGELVETRPGISAGTLPAPSGRWDRELPFGMPYRVMNWYDGHSTGTVLKVTTRPSLLYHRLFAAWGEFAGGVLIALAFVALVFALIELIALITGIRLTRTMTRSVAALYNATRHINRGNLKHRIKVTSDDQLAALETSFNSMTESLEKLIAEQKEKQRMESELAIAQEVQAQLFPRELSHLTSLEVHGVCRPARTVSGDYYDFLTLGTEKLGMAVGDISGKGISAALLMATVHSAVRVYEFGRIPFREELMMAGAAAMAATQGGVSTAPSGAIQSPAAVLHLLNRHLYQSTPAEKYATLFLATWDGAARQLSYSNGGHLPPLVVGSDGTIRRLECGGMVIGLFDDMQWDEERVELHPGDIFLAYSDGVTEPENEFGEFGEKRLIELVQTHRHLPLDRISEMVITAVTDWIGANEQPDDITLVLARAK